MNVDDYFFFFSATLIDCGATVPSVIDGRQWLPDAGFVFGGTTKALTTTVLSSVLSTVRSFPVSGNLRRKFCYTVPAYRTGKYLIRTTYFYGGINGRNSPPVFDQIVDGTFWSVVNTTEDYFRGNSSYYEGVFVARGKSISVCVAANTYTDSDPFISALELVLLSDSLYNSTDFGAYALSLVARHSFGYEGSIIRWVVYHPFVNLSMWEYVCVCVCVCWDWPVYSILVWYFCGISCFG